MVPAGESLNFIAGTSFRYRLPEITDPDGDPTKINYELVNDACPWLTLNIENRRIDVVRGATD